MNKNIPSAPGLLSLSKEEMDSMLKGLREKSGDNALPMSRSALIRRTGRRIDQASRQMEEIFDHTARTGMVPLEDVRKDIVPVIREAAAIPHLNHLFYELKSKDEYTYRHTICVGIISALIGKWLDLEEEELSDLTLGAILHDVGKARIPSAILNKPGKLTKEEYAEMKRHTIYGYEMLKDLPGIGRKIPLIALQHHEREDGAGYPLGLTSNKVEHLAKIVAIADVYHAMSSARVYHRPEPFHIVISQMQNDVFGKFDPKIMVVFLYRMMLNLVGQRVELNDGSKGTLVMVDSYEPLRGLIQVGEELIDLRFNRTLAIAKVLEEESGEEV
ncbi:HD-GYP domain-containing protein [Mesobacillus zeae]|nr:HD-GYP domain-containing protein [Mesobacillus zeae]